MLKMNAMKTVAAISIAVICISTFIELLSKWPTASEDKNSLDIYADTETLNRVDSKTRIIDIPCLNLPNFKQYYTTGDIIDYLQLDRKQVAITHVVPANRIYFVVLKLNSKYSLCCMTVYDMKHNPFDDFNVLVYAPRLIYNKHVSHFF